MIEVNELELTMPDGSKFLLTPTMDEAAIDHKIAELVDSAPEQLNTLKKLADALGGDENFSNMVLTKITDAQTKADSAYELAEAKADLVDGKVPTTQLPYAPVPEPDFYLPLRDNIHIALGNGYTEFTRNGTATYWENGVLKTAEIDEPRFENGKILLEATATNLVPKSEGWTELPSPNGSPTGEFGRPSPDDGNGAMKIISGGTGYDGIRIYLPNAENVSTCWSVWLRSDDEATVSIIASKKEQKLTTEWERYIIPVEGERGTFALYIREGQSCEVFGVQAEKGLFATSYMPTKGVASTRAKDGLYIKDTNVPCANKGSYTLLTKLSNITLPVTGFNDLFDVSVNNNIIRVYPDNTLFSYIASYGVSTSVPSNNNADVTVSYDSETETQCLYVDGVQVGSRTGIVQAESGFAEWVHLEGGAAQADLRWWHECLTPEQISMIK